MQEGITVRNNYMRFLKRCSELSVPILMGKLFQSEGTSNLKARLPMSLLVKGTIKKGCWVCQREYEDVYGIGYCFR